MRAKVTHLQPLAHHPDMDADRLAEARRLLSACAEAPDDAKAQTVARWLRESLTPDDPLAARMRGLLSDYALALIDGDSLRVSELAREVRRLIASAMAPGSGARN